MNVHVLLIAVSWHFLTMAPTVNEIQKIKEAENKLTAHYGKWWETGDFPSRGGNKLRADPGQGGERPQLGYWTLNGGLDDDTVNAKNH
jgi:hypothetical protein